jgi:hypothetical protein
MPPNKVQMKMSSPFSTFSSPFLKTLFCFSTSPYQIEQNVSGLLNLLPDQSDELLQRVDQPLEEVSCLVIGAGDIITPLHLDGFVF